MHWPLSPFVAAATIFPLNMPWLQLISKNPQNDCSFHSLSNNQISETFNWDTITPCPKIEYHPCCSSFQCARLSVPLDWKNSSNSRKVSIALIKLPSQVPVTDPRYGGPILLNPGGPGGSGINLALGYGSNIQKIVDSPFPSSDSSNSSHDTVRDKYFDIISFDPRGVGYTKPSFNCFNNGAERAYWDVNSKAEGLMGSSDVAFERLWARKKTLAETCVDKMKRDGNEIGRFMNTPVVAMDLAAIVEGLSTPRTEEREEGKRKGRLAQIILDEEEEKVLQYWGFSYGTLLGQTFAAMFPHLVGKMVLDGVVDSDRHYSGSYVGQLESADAIVSAFSSHCFRAGLQHCALFSPEGPKVIQFTLDKVLNSILHSPLSVLGTESRGPDVVIYSDVLIAVRDALYEPFSKSEGLARIIHDLSQQNGTSLAEYKAKQRGSSESEEGLVDYSEESVSAIACSDGADQRGMTKAEFWHYWQDLRNNESKYLGDRWAMNKLGCVFWGFRPNWEFEGIIGGKTKEPMLFVGNTLDPVTSFENARKASKKFSGSRPLEQKSEGTGALPKVGTICEVFDGPLRMPGPGSEVALEDGDEELLKALRSMAKELW